MGTETVAQLPQELEEARLGWADATRALDRLDDDGGEIGFAAAEPGRDAVGVAPRQLDDQPADRVGDAGRSGHHQVVRAVIAPVELRDQRPAGERPGGPDREHRRLGPGRREAEVFNRWHPPTQLLGELDLGLRRRSEG